MFHWQTLSACSRMPLTFAFQSRFIFANHRPCTICLSRHSGLSTPYQLERRIMVQKSSLFEIDKGRETVFPIKHSGLIWAARLERWSNKRVRSEEHVWPQSHPSCLTVQEGRHAFSAALSLLENPGLFIKHQGCRLGCWLFFSDRWPDDRCVAETMANLQQSDRVVLVRNRPTQIALKMT